MSKKGSRASGRAVLASAILLATCGAQAAAPSRQLTAFDAGAVERARAGAVRRLESERCRKLFTDFTDAEGRTLQRNLEEWGASPAEYVGLIPFLDGSRHPLCRKASIALVASPGVRRD